MGIKESFSRLFNPDNGDDYQDNDDYGYENDLDDGYSDNGYGQGNQNGNSYYQAPQNTGSSMGLDSGALELKVIKPEKYDSTTAQKVADHLLSRRTVVLNLEATNKESARRLIDFLSGVAYSIGGYIQRVANNTFVIVPKNVDISGEQLQEAKKQEETDLF